MWFDDSWSEYLGDRVKFVFSPDVILCGWLGSRHQLTHQLQNTVVVSPGLRSSTPVTRGLLPSPRRCRVPVQVSCNLLCIPWNASYKTTLKIRQKLCLKKGWFLVRGFVYMNTYMMEIFQGNWLKRRSSISLGLSFTSLVFDQGCHSSEVLLCLKIWSAEPIWKYV